MSNLKTRLAKHFGIAAVATAAATSANAQIVHSGIVNQTIASSFNGLYLNVVTGQDNEPGNTGGSTVAGWDINLWGTGTFSLFSPGTPAASHGFLQVGGAAGNLSQGDTIGSGGTYANTSNTAVWNLNSDGNLIGFRFFNEANSQIHYGWARVEFGGDLGTRTLVEYAYEATAGASIGAGVVPAPSAAALLGLGGLVAARRRRA